MNTAFLFAAAAILAVLPILFLFKLNMEKIKENPSEIGSIQTKFFIGVAISEVIPIILIVFGMMNLTPVESLNELLVPGIIVIFALIFAPFFIFLQRFVGAPEESKQAITTFSMIGLALANAIPLISFISLIMLMP
ncbi:hypothetical protein [Ornithinibacillus bavariensis]|uniref:Uncharacterized protein n=1 Tax=Ornithinibacillus bavariensis TaxID=545502 RepID=A0A919X8D7_9BACI|nr:hypothetical protein [Ornithinibacillus bavariensis]GIO26909.1 hypothetical protein J43TS3_15200 [Ornithinibacillus bavariensis]HAM80647.1 hypothetical protein [Ornithinibacillus sp.]